MRSHGFIVKLASPGAKDESKAAAANLGINREDVLRLCQDGQLFAKSGRVIKTLSLPLNRQLDITDLIQ